MMASECVDILIEESENFKEKYYKENKNLNKTKALNG